MKVSGLVLAVVGIVVVCVVFMKRGTPTPENERKKVALSNERRILEDAALEEEARAIEVKLSRELVARLEGVAEEERSEVAARFREEFSDELAREQEIEDVLNDPSRNPALLRPDPVFSAKRDRILSIAGLIREGHSVEEAERIHAEAQEQANGSINQIQ